MKLKQAISWLGFRLRPVELLPFLFSSPTQDQDLVLLTAADSKYFKSLCQLLTSVLLHEPGIRIVAFDLGLTQAERDHLHTVFAAVELRTFDYSRYPEYFNVKVEKGQYAWKPVIVWEVLDEFRCTVCWMDAGNLVTHPLTWLKKIVRHRGIYVARSIGCIRDWTHAGTLEYLNVSDGLLDKYNLSAALVIADYRDLRARRIFEQWKDCALAKECIAPAGSSRANHRQDQAVLSVIAHQSGITRAMPKGRYGYKIQQNID